MAEVGGAQSRIASVDRALARGAATQPFAWIARNLEAEQERWFLWLPVMFGTGIALYFLLPVEPGLLAPAAGRGGAGGAPRRRAQRVAGAGDGGAAGGRARRGRGQAAHGGDARAGAQRQIGPVDVYGFVELVEPRPSKGQRLTIRVAALEKHEAARVALRVRVRTMTRERARCEPGDAVRLKATLSPPPGPALPGDYDFARAAWFQALGAVGYADRRRRDRCRAAGAAAVAAFARRRSRVCGRRSAGASSRRCRARPAPSPMRSSPASAAASRRRPTRRSATPACSTSSPSPACTW